VITMTDGKVSNDARGANPRAEATS
jgi:hypothetical protein